MMTNFRPHAVCLAAALIAGSWLLSPAAARAEGEIVGVRASSLSLYESAEGQRIDSLDRAAVAMPLDVEEVAPNRRLKVTIDGRTVWLAPHQVIMAEGVTVESGCISVSPQYASTRALGSCE